MSGWLSQVVEAASFAQVAPIEAPAVDAVGLLPAAVPACGALILLLIHSLAPDRFLSRTFDAAFTIALLGGALASVAALWQRDEAVVAFEGQFVLDGAGLFVAGVVLVSAAMVAATLPRFCERTGAPAAELCVLLLLASAGAVVMAGAADLIVLFLGLETMSIAAYVMVALDLRRSESLEAGIKYFVLGAFSTAFLLYGIAFVYGAAGSMRIADVGQYLDDNLLLRDGMLLGGLAMLLVGLGFKVAAVPFHAWAPDVYQGAPTPVTAFMASAVKAAGFAAVLRVFVEALARRADDWRPAVFALACATLLVGSLLAAVQTDVKRLLAYSSVAHAGFLLVGVQAASDRGASGVLFYLAAYAVIAVGSFTVLGALSGDGDDRTGLEDLVGLGSRRPALALAFTLLLLAQAGVPFTSGFVAKFSVIAAAADTGAYWLAAAAMLSAVVAAFAYLRVIVAMYFDDAPTDARRDRQRHEVGLATSTVIVAAVVVTVAFGVLPGSLQTLADNAVALVAQSPAP